MSDKDGGPAFPSPSGQKNRGMTLRDYFAAQALGGIIASYTGEDLPLPQDNSAAMRAYNYADAMLAERVK